MNCRQSGRQRVYIGLGSNLNNPNEQLVIAASRLSTSDYLSEIRFSSVYQSKPLGPKQPDYCNAVISGICTLPPIELLRQLQRVELDQGRVKIERWGPRIIDLDILLYGDRVLHSPELTIPHPEIINRNFVIVPLYELSPDMCFPDNTSIKALFSKLDDKQLPIQLNSRSYRLACSPSVESLE